MDKSVKIKESTHLKIKKLKKRMKWSARDIMEEAVNIYFENSKQLMKA